MDSFANFERKTLYPYYNYEIGGEDAELDFLHQLLVKVSTGNYVEALQEKECQKALNYSQQCRDSNTCIYEYYKTNLRKYIEDKGTQGEQVVYSIGVSCLQLFIQNNFCGPLVGPSASSLLPGLIPDNCKEEEYNTEEALRELILDAESVYTLLSVPEYLILARIIFFELKEHFTSCISIDWWCCRYSIIHQKVADEQSPSINDVLLKSLLKTENNKDLLDETLYRDIAALFHLEAVQIYLHYFDVGNAKIHFERALSILGMVINLSGALGMRTKWQQQEIAQLVVKVSYNENSIKQEEEIGPAFLPCDLPKDILLTDDTRLHKIKYVEEDEDVIPNLKPIEQMVLLAHLILKRKSQALDIQLNDETKAYLMAILQYPKNWSMQLSALVMRSRVESGEVRAMERSMTQYEELVASVHKEEPSRFERLKLIFSSLLLTHWNLQQELARMFMRLGCTKSALDLFERLHLWEDVIFCYNELQMRQRSAEIIKNLLDKEETPRLWCLMGDATDDVECYHKAWELSKHRSGRAQRCLGNYYYVRKQHLKAISHFENSVEINSLQFPVWQRMAYCALQVEDWEKCASSYRRCSILEPDNFECWNNMSQAYLKLGQSHRAWKSLQEALRCNMNSWRLWDNFMLVSTSLGYFTQALNAYNRIINLKERHVDTEVLGRIVQAVLSKKVDPDGQQMYALHKKCTELLGKLTREVPTNPELWFLYAELIYFHPETCQETKHTAMQHYRKAVAAATQKPGWEKTSDTCCLVLMRALRLLHVAEEVVKELDDRAAVTDLSSIRMLIRGLISSVKRSQINVNTGEMVEELQVPLKDVETEILHINNLIEQLRSKTSL